MMELFARIVETCRLFSQKIPSQMFDRFQNMLLFQEDFKVNLQHLMLFDTKTEVFTQNEFFWKPGDDCPHLFVH